MSQKRARVTATPTSMPVVFERADGRRYRARFLRDDGVTVTFGGASHTQIGGSVGHIPHDMAHLIVERELGLVGGVWGTLAAGGLLDRATTVVEGRQKPHAAQRGRDLVSAARDSIIESEVVVRVICHASTEPRPTADAVRRELGDRAPLPHLDDAALTRIVERLRETARAWADGPPEHRLRLVWDPHASRRQATGA